MSDMGTGNGAEGRRPSASEAELVADLKPSGALERMMIEQMARAHDTTMACFDRAEAAPEGAGREVELRLAARFMALFMQQAATLDRRRARARQAEEAAQRLSFDARAKETRARMAHWEDSLRRAEGAGAPAEADGFDELDDFGDLDDPDDPGGLEAAPDPAALRAMAERLGLPSPIGADGHIDPDALAAIARRTRDMLLGGAGDGADGSANSSG